MRYDAEHKARTRAKVLEEAARAIRAEGPQNIGVAGVMSRAGLTHGGFYAHFGSKDALVAEAMAETFRDGAAMFERAISGRPPREALARYIDRYLSARHRDAPEAGCPLPALAGELSRLGPEARARFAEGVQRLTLRVQGLLEAADIGDAAAEASSVLSEMVGALSLARATPDPAQSEAILARSRAALRRRLGLDPELGPKAVS